MGFLDKYRPVLAIDAGTQSLRVSKDGEMIFNEATAIAIHPEKHKVDQIVGQGPLQGQEVLSENLSGGTNKAA